MTLSDWLTSATTKLQTAHISSARLDAEILLAHTLRKNRTYLHGHGEEPLSNTLLAIADARLELRIGRVPIAYIIGHKEFYGRLFAVSPQVLIPRPESETLIDLLKEFAKPQHRTLLDVGCGSGCLGITAKLELSQLDVILLDISNNALTVAEKNAYAHHVTVRILASNLLQNYHETPNIIIANLPYVDSDWERSPETNYEPAQALFADDNGLTLIKQLIKQAAPRMLKGGLLLLEADPCQHDTIVLYAKNHDFVNLTRRDYGIVLEKA